MRLCISAGHISEARAMAEGPVNRFKRLTDRVAGLRTCVVTALAVIALGAAVSAAGWRPIIKSDFDARFASLSKELLRARCNGIRVLLAVNRNARTNSYRERRQTKAAAALPPSPALVREIEDLEQERAELLIKKAKYCPRIE